MAREKAKQKPRPGRPVLTHDVKTRIDAELYQRIQERAKLEDRSESAIVRRALREFLGVGA
jgi:hypothetical protein